MWGHQLKTQMEKRGNEFLKKVDLDTRFEVVAYVPDRTDSFRLEVMSRDVHHKAEGLSLHYTDMLAFGFWEIFDLEVERLASWAVKT